MHPKRRKNNQTALRSRQGPQGEGEEPWNFCQGACSHAVLLLGALIFLTVEPGAFSNSWSPRALRMRTEARMKAYHTCLLARARCLPNTLAHLSEWLPKNTCSIFSYVPTRVLFQGKRTQSLPILMSSRFTRTKPSPRRKKIRLQQSKANKMLR